MTERAIKIAIEWKNMKQSNYGTARTNHERTQTIYNELHLYKRKATPNWIHTNKDQRQDEQFNRISSFQTEQPTHNGLTTAKVSIPAATAERRSILARVNKLVQAAHQE